MLDSNISTYIDKDGNVQEVGSFDSSKFVTLDTAQTISGSKIFNDSLKVQSSTESSNYLTLSPVSISLQDVATPKGLTVGVDSIESVSMYSQGGTQILKFQTENMGTEDTATLTLPTKSGTIALTSDLPDTSKFLTTDTAQDITATKTFMSLPSFMGLSGEGITFFYRNDSVKLQIENNYQGTGNNTIILPRKDGTLATLDDISTTVKSILLAAFPVGTTVMSPTDPAEFIGGSWKKETAGKFFRTAETETIDDTDGGSDDAIVVSHTHSLYRSLSYGAKGAFNGGVQYLGGDNFYDSGNYIEVQTTGQSGTDANLPTYKGRKFWTRIN